MCNVTFPLPRTEERRYSWQLQSKQIRQKAQIGVNIKMPVHFIVSDGFLTTMLWQANQCTRSFVCKALLPFPWKSRTAAYTARHAAGALPKNRKLLLKNSPPERQPQRRSSLLT